jgi:hypothetical protein
MFQACDDTKTYAEQLEDEDNAIKDFISKNNIKVLSLADFEAKGTTTDLKTNEYVALSGGVYMQIVDKGTGDSIKNNDIVLVRFMEYDIMSQDTTSVSNYDVDGWVDEFRYSLSVLQLQVCLPTQHGDCIWDCCYFRMVIGFEVRDRLRSCEANCSFQNGT